MAKPPSSNRSIRLPDSLWAVVVAGAELKGVSVNEIVRRAVATGLPMLDESPANQIGAILNASPTRSEPLLDAKGDQITYGGIALHVDVPVYKRPAFNPRPKGGKK